MNFFGTVSQHYLTFEDWPVSPTALIQFNFFATNTFPAEPESFASATDITMNEWQWNIWNHKQNLFTMTMALVRESKTLFFYHLIDIFNVFWPSDLSACKKTLPKALRTQALTALTISTIWKKTEPPLLSSLTHHTNKTLDILVKLRLGLVW